MNIFYVPITNKASLNNYQNTIINRVNFSKKSINSLNLSNVKNDVGIWGIKNGKYNIGHFDKINKGDYLFFRGKNQFKQQILLSVGKVLGTQNDSNKISSLLWNDPDYCNLIFIKNLYVFQEPIIVSEKNKKLIDKRLITMDNSDFHNAYNMFRQWNMISEEIFIQKIFDLVKYNQIY